jgi:hypothetical protein
MLKPGYRCECTHPVPLVHLGEDTGLCQACTMVYDEGLYEMRLRQHVTNWTWETIHDFLMETDQRYQLLPTSS